MIQKKKEKIGAGYLTDQGALFLIASDLGVSLNEPLKVEMGLKGSLCGGKGDNTCHKSDECLSSKAVCTQRWFPVFVTYNDSI